MHRFHRQNSHQKLPPSTPKKPENGLKFPKVTACRINKTGGLSYTLNLARLPVPPLGHKSGSCEANSLCPRIAAFVNAPCCPQTEHRAETFRRSDLVGAAPFTFLVKGADFRLIANVFSSGSDHNFVE